MEGVSPETLFPTAHQFPFGFFPLVLRTRAFGFTVGVCFFGFWDGFVVGFLLYPQHSLYISVCLNPPVYTYQEKTVRKAQHVVPLAS